MSSSLLNHLLSPTPTFPSSLLLSLSPSALFSLLPLLLSPPPPPDKLSLLLLRISSHRALKLRLLLLLSHPSYSSLLSLSLPFDPLAYISSRHSLLNQRSSFQGSPTLTRTKSANLRLHARNPENLVHFAAAYLFHPTHGLALRPLHPFLRALPRAFRAPALLNRIMEVTNIRDRHAALELGKQLFEKELFIPPPGVKGAKFKDKEKRIYQANVQVTKKETQLQVVHKGNVELIQDPYHSEERKGQIPVDLIDLQSLDFWIHTVARKDVSEGFRFPTIAVTHPLFELGDENRNDDDDVSDVNEKDNQGETDPSLDDNEKQMESVVDGVCVKKTFSSLTRPRIVSLEKAEKGKDMTKRGGKRIGKMLLVKEGDNLMGDLSVQTLFQVFNHVWKSSSIVKADKPPLCKCYEVFPTGATTGFMEAMEGLVSLKDFNWTEWKNKCGGNQVRVRDMVRSAAGGYIGAYVCGARDRHFDNVLIQDERYVVHIDFGFVLGHPPPIDSPAIAISPMMEETFRELKVWEMFLDLCVDAFLALRAEAPMMTRALTRMFAKAGYEEEEIREWAMGKGSLNVREEEEKAGKWVRKQFVVSSRDLMVKVKGFTHDTVNPLVYGLVDMGFPPAVMFMKAVEAIGVQEAKRKVEKK